MTILVVLSTISAISIIASIFLISEFKKKFTFMKNYVASCPFIREFPYPGNRTFGTQRGMRNIVLRSTSGEDFSALIGFELRMFGLSGYDYYGYAESKDGILIFQIFLGATSILTQFLLNKNIGVSISSSAADQALAPNAIYQPHWWQKHLAFWG